MEHVPQYARPFPWRAAAIVVGAIAIVELAVLVVMAGPRLADAFRHPAAPAKPAPAKSAPAKAATARTATARRAPAGTLHLPTAPPARPLRPRARVSVLVLNGNGINGAAGAEARRLEGLGYASATAADAARLDYARSIVMFAPGWRREGQRLARDAGAHLVAPLEGVQQSQLGSARLVLILGR